MHSMRCRGTCLRILPHGLVLAVALVASGTGCSYLSYDITERAIEEPPQEVSAARAIRVEHSELVGTSLELEIAELTRVDHVVAMHIEKTVDYKPKGGMVYTGFGVDYLDPVFSVLYFIPDAFIFLASTVVMVPAGAVAAIDSSDEKGLETERDVAPLADAPVDVSIDALEVYEHAVTDAAGGVKIDLSAAIVPHGGAPLSLRVHSRADGRVAKARLTDEQLAGLPRAPAPPVKKVQKAEAVEDVSIVAVNERAPAPPAPQTSARKKPADVSGPVRAAAAVGGGLSRRVALVIGNSEYRDLPKLANPARDASDLAAALESAGFEVLLRTEQNLSQMKSSLREFGAHLGPDAVGLFYFAGHAIQAGGSNFLIPLGADIAAQDEIEHEALDMGRVLGKMESSQSPVKLVFVDACRNNPYSRFRSATRGLAITPAPVGTLIAYATAPGDVASDGDGDNSPFARHLISAIDTPGLELKEVITRVQQGVYVETDSRQRPWLSSDIFLPFYFHETQAN